ncbi:unnamed protein product [Adineta steineri]|uniref:G-protein coupled receptors family 1 profile domain-containing protein n=2 Tax=Adineta steineri TaxID=433720 RepID=A0A815PKH2_9BILA|nr:unnamed protein product [Adineta steineri]
MCYINSTTIGLILINGFNVYLHNYNNFLCKTYFYSAFLFDTLSPTILILASVDRLLISSQNVDTRLYSSKRLAYFSITLNTLFWIIFNSHILIKVSVQQNSPTNYICYYNFSKFYINFVAYSSTIIHIAFFLLMIILCMLTFKNVRFMRTVPHGKRHHIRSMTNRDFQLLRCLFVQDILFIIFVNACLSSVSNVLFTYSTVKLIKVPHTSIALVHRLLQLLIFVYIIGYIVIWKKGYQQFQEPHGTSIIKVKGIARVDGNNTFFYTSDAKKYIWDTPEYELPPLENNAFFIATRQTITYNQTQSICPTALADKSFCNDQNKTLCKTDEPTSSTFEIIKLMKMI